MLYKAWKAAGEQIAQTERWIRLHLKFYGVTYVCLAGYAPTQSTPNAVVERDRFFDGGEKLLEVCRDGDKTIVFGDFNSHIGSDCDYHDCVGKRLLSTPTASRPQPLRHFPERQNFKLVDSFQGCVKRGTWYNNINKRWYENDTFIGGTISQRLRVRTVIIEVRWLT